MKRYLSFAVFTLSLSILETPVSAQSNPLATHLAQLASKDPKQRTSALKQLGAAGTAAQSAAPAVAKALRDPDFTTSIAAARALPQIVGPEKAAKAFDAIVRDATAVKSHPVALIGLETCGSIGLSTVTFALKNGNAPIQSTAILTASIIDTEGTLYSDILPLLIGQTDQMTREARKYILAHGIRKFFAEHSRWPTDFIEVESYVRKSNALITLVPLTHTVQIRFEPEPDGALKVRTYSPQPDGTFKTGTYYVIQKPQKK